MKSLHIFLNTAHSASKPSTFISSFTHSYQVSHPLPAHLTLPMQTFFCVNFFSPSIIFPSFYNNCIEFEPSQFGSSRERIAAAIAAASAAANAANICNGANAQRSPAKIECWVSSKQEPTFDSLGSRTALVTTLLLAQQIAKIPTFGNPTWNPPKIV